MATLKAEHLAELHKLRGQSAALLEVMAQIEPPFANTAREFTQLLEKLALLQDLKGMREMARELREMMIAVPPDRRPEVLAHVRKVSGFPLEVEEAKDTAAARRILARGKIRNDREYYLLRGHLSILEAQDAAQSDLSSVHALLDSYRS